MVSHYGIDIERGVLALSGQTVVAIEFPSVPVTEAMQLPVSEMPNLAEQRQAVVMNALSRRLWTLEIHRRLEIKARDLLAQA